MLFSSQWEFLHIKYVEQHYTLNDKTGIIVITNKQIFETISKKLT